MQNTNNSTCRGSSRKAVKRPVRPNAFACATLLAAGLALTGCGRDSRCYNPERPSPPTEQDPQPNPEVEPETNPCHNVVASLDCHTPRIAVDLQEGESVRIDQGLIIAFTPGPEGYDIAEMRAFGSDCEENSSSQVNVGDSYPITIGVGSEEGYMEILSIDGDSVEIEAALPLIVSGDLNQGESLIVPVQFPADVSVVLDDISIYPTNEPPSALLSVVSDTVTVDHMEVQEGEAQPMGIFDDTVTVGAREVSPGYTFGAIRAELELFYCGQL